MEPEENNRSIVSVSTLQELNRHLDQEARHSAWSRIKFSWIAGECLEKKMTAGNTFLLHHSSRHQALLQDPEHAPRVDQHYDETL